MIFARAPLRMSFVGGGSDLPSYYRNKEGAVLSTSIDKYVYVAVNKKFDNDIRLSYSITENTKSVTEIKHPIVRNALELLGISNGVEITSISDIPSQGSGLGSSSTFTVALLHALSAFQTKDISKDELGRLSSHIEIDLCGEKIGKQDQYAAAFGGMNLIEFKRDDSVKVSKINCTSETISKLQKSILLFYTGRTRRASDLLINQSKNMADQNKFEMMSTMVAYAYEMRNILEKGDLDSFGKLLDENWQLKIKMAEGISDSEINSWYRQGISAGATGGKLLGAGNGGFMMFYAPIETHSKIENALKPLRRIPFSFEDKGSKIIFRKG